MFIEKEGVRGVIPDLFLRGYDYVHRLNQFNRRQFKTYYFLSSHNRLVERKKRFWEAEDDRKELKVAIT